MRLLRRLTVLALALALASPSPRTARAEGREVAPGLAAEELREGARHELRRAIGALAPEEQRRLAGTYVAFDEDGSDPLALAACDDDGDHVVVLSEAMLRLVSDVARASAADERDGARRVEEYASFLARSQVSGRRLLPPPPGTFTTARTTDLDALAAARRVEALAFVVGHEVARLRAGDVTCPNPTVTREEGDEVWTREERRRALEVAGRVYGAGARQVPRDEETARRLLAIGRDVTGALALLRFTEQLERERLLVASPFAPTWVTLHPSAATRAAAIRAVAAEPRRDRR